MGCDIIVNDVHAGFQEKLCFWRMGCDIFIVDEWNYCLYLTCVVWGSGECESQAWKKYVYAECDLLLMLLLMIMLIWNEVVVVSLFVYGCVDYYYYHVFSCEEKKM